MGTAFQKAKIVQELSVTIYYQKRLSDLDTIIKITITKIISFQHQKYLFNIKLLKLIWFKLWRKSCVSFLVSFSSFPVPSISGNGGLFNTPEFFFKTNQFY